MDIRERLIAIANEYPSSLRSHQVLDATRVAFNIALALAGRSAGAKVADIGGGLGLFAPGCAALGMRVTLVDDFQDPGNIEIVREILKLHRRYGIEVVERDVVSEGVDLPANSFDTITTFGSMEHWHHSPKRVFRQLVSALRPGGRFIIGVPNCVNMRKRLTVPFGVGKWSQMEDWYEQERFRGHVREPDVDDLRYIANDLGLSDARYVGRNWAGFKSPRWLIRAATHLADKALRLFPTLCADIYLIARKPQ